MRSRIGPAHSGKEADEEVGLTYFGERYLVPRIGRWASPDPLAIHAEGGGEALNAYHYVSGNLLQARDPLGLDPGDIIEVENRPASNASGAGEIVYHAEEFRVQGRLPSAEDTRREFQLKMYSEENTRLQNNLKVADVTAKGLTTIAAAGAGPAIAAELGTGFAMTYVSTKAGLETYADEVKQPDTSTGKQVLRTGVSVVTGALEPVLPGGLAQAVESTSLEAVRQVVGNGVRDTDPSQAALANSGRAVLGSASSWSPAVIVDQSGVQPGSRGAIAGNAIVALAQGATQAFIEAAAALHDPGLADPSSVSAGAPCSNCSYEAE